MFNSQELDINITHHVKNRFPDCDYIYEYISALKPYAYARNGISQHKWLSVFHASDTGQEHRRIHISDADVVVVVFVDVRIVVIPQSARTSQLFDTVEMQTTIYIPNRRGHSPHIAHVICLHTTSQPIWRRKHSTNITPF